MDLLLVIVALILAWESPTVRVGEGAVTARPRTPERGNSQMAGILVTVKIRQAAEGGAGALSKEAVVLAISQLMEGWSRGWVTCRS